MYDLLKYTALAVLALLCPFLALAVILVMDKWRW